MNLKNNVSLRKLEKLSFEPFFFHLAVASIQLPGTPLLNRRFEQEEEEKPDCAATSSKSLPSNLPIRKCIFASFATTQRDVVGLR